MNAHETLRAALTGSDNIAKAYLDDLSDDELLVRPVEGCNHIAWQLGHLISSENYMMEQIHRGAMPSLPEGFREQHSGESAGVDDAGAFLKKDDYLKLYDDQRKGTLALLETLSAEDLDQPAPESLKRLAPTVGGLFAMQATHLMMHAGQWAIVRRKLGRPPLF